MTRKYSQNASDKIGKTMHEFKHGTLKSGGSGKRVKSRKQAIAIGIAQAQRAGYKVPSIGHARKKSPAQLDREIATALGSTSRPGEYVSLINREGGGWQQGYDYAKESSRHKTRAEQREVLKRVAPNARDASELGLVAGYQDVLGDPRSGHKAHTVKKAPRPTPYRIKLTPSEIKAVEFARGRYSWPDMLSAHASEDGSIAFTESEMWQWTDDVDSDDAPFSLASSAFASKLQNFYDKRV